MLKEAIIKLKKGTDLELEESYQVMKEVLKVENPEEVTQFLLELKAKGESEQEVMGFIKAVREEGVPIEFSGDLLDIVGTGGDGANTLNISTGSGILAASCGIPIVKHGNRAHSSKCGSADVVEEMGIDLMMSDEKLAQCMKELNISFLFAPRFYPSLKKVKSIRRKLNTSTVFNLLGPLVNPAAPKYYLMGVSDDERLEFFAKMFHKIGVKKALIYHGLGLDEITTLGPIEAYEVSPSGIQKRMLDLKDYGFNQGTLAELVGGNPEENAKRLKETFDGKSDSFSETLIFNVGIALYITEKVPSIEEGIILAKDAFVSKRALKVIERWVEISGEEE